MLRMPRSTALPDVKQPVDYARLLLDTKEELLRVTEKLPRARRTQSLSETANASRTVYPQGQNDRQHSVRPVMDQKQVVVTGVLAAFGKDRRDLHGEWITQFFVDVASDDLNGQLTRLWGADLYRALNEAQAGVGDHVTVKQVGRVPCVIPQETTDEDGTKRRTQRTSQKNSYVVVKQTPYSKEHIHAQGH